MQKKTTSPDPAAIQQKIVHKQFGEALADLERLLASDGNHADALYMSAVCRRYRREFDVGLELLARLKALTPDNGRAYQEEGHTWRDMGRPDDALRAYARACRLNPALLASWRGQLAILEFRGNAAHAGQVRAQLEYLERLPDALVAVMDLAADGKLVKAEELCRRFLRKVPHHVEGMRLLADIGLRLGVLEDAEFLLQSALKFEPDNLRVRIDYVQALRKRQKFAAAREEAERLLAAAPENPQFQSIFAVESLQCGEYDAALAAFDRVLESLPGDPVTLTSRGHALKTCGRYDDAVASYRAARESNPRHGEASYALANLKVYRFGDREIDAMQSVESDAALGHMDRVYLCFALGKAFEDRADYATSFRYYERGNRLKKAQSRYDAGHMRAEFEKQVEVCSASLFERRQGTGHAAPDPIFVLGMPRAGSTLIEQILSSHSMIDGTLELPNILSLSQRLRRRGRRDANEEYPQILETIPDAELAGFGEDYIRDTRIHRAGAPFFVDKMPNNFRHVGLIRLILPNAKIIDARREPLACCFSGFKQLFAEGQEFTYDLADLGNYYRDYVDLMAHWDEVLPGFVLRVRHEDVVNDLEREVRRMLDFCDLPFEDRCLSYYETDRRVRTPSSEQVRKPISRAGLTQWKNYEKWLGPLKDALGPVLAEGGG